MPLDPRMSMMRSRCLLSHDASVEIVQFASNDPANHGYLLRPGLSGAKTYSISRRGQGRASSARLQRVSERASRSSPDKHERRVLCSSHAIHPFLGNALLDCCFTTPRLFLSILVARLHLIVTGWAALTQCFLSVANPPLLTLIQRRCEVTRSHSSCTSGLSPTSSP